MPTRRSALLFIRLMAVVPLVAPLWTLPATAKDNGNGNHGKGNDGNRGKGSESGNGGRNGKGGARSNVRGSAQPSAVSSGVIAAVVRHPNGLEESIVRGRYIMKDSKGRTIVNRLASRADRERLEALKR